MLLKNRDMHFLGFEECLHMLVEIRCPFCFALRAIPMSLGQLSPRLGIFILCPVVTLLTL